MMSDDILKDCPMTAEAIDDAEKTFGKDMCEMQGKTTRQKPNKVTATHCDSPKETMKAHENATKVADTFFANKMPMLLTGSDKMKFLTVSFVEDRTMSTRFNSLKISRLQDGTKLISLPGAA